MKKFLTLIILFALFVSPINAQTATPTDKPNATTVPEDSEELEKIQKIKDIVASKVAELDLVEKRGIIGKIKENKNMSISIEDIKGKTRNIDVDELTEFSIGDDDEDDLGVSDLEKDTLYSFVGLYNKDTERLLARSISEADAIPVLFEGAISGIDEVEFQITVVNSKGVTKTVEIENSTKTNLSTIDGELEKSGFSKLELNKRVLVVGFLDEDDDSIITGRRVTHFEEVPPSKEMQQFVSQTSTSSDANKETEE